MSESTTALATPDEEPDKENNAITWRSSSGDINPYTVRQWAEAIANSAFCPKHLTWATDPAKTVANCMRVVDQAIRWGISPFAAADESYVANGKLCFQGKLVAAIVNTRAGLVGKLLPVYSGVGADRRVTIVGQFKDETAPRTIDCTLRQSVTSNEMWSKDPDQKLWYTGAVKWARRHCPQLLLGISTTEDMEASGVVVDGADVNNLEVSHGSAEKQTGSAVPLDRNGDGGEAGQTLQSAIAREAEKAPPLGTVGETEPANPFQLQQLAGELGMFFAALGLPPAPEGTAKRQEVRLKVYAKFGVSKAADLTARKVDDMLAFLGAKLIEMRNAREGAQVSH